MWNAFIIIYPIFLKLRVIRLTSEVYNGTVKTVQNYRKINFVYIKFNNEVE